MKDNQLYQRQPCGDNQNVVFPKEEDEEEEDERSASGQMNYPKWPREYRSK